jgi:hypothetical protein
MSTRPSTNPVSLARAHYFTPDGHAPPAKTQGCTAVSPRLLIRMRSQVQVLAGPPINPAGQSVVGFPVTTLSASLVHIWSTSGAKERRVRQRWPVSLHETGWSRLDCEDRGRPGARPCKLLGRYGVPNQCGERRVAQRVWCDEGMVVGADPSRHRSWGRHRRRLRPGHAPGLARRPVGRHHHHHRPGRPPSRLRHPLPAARRLG